MLREPSHAVSSASAKWLTRSSGCTWNLQNLQPPVRTLLVATSSVVSPPSVGKDFNKTVTSSGLTVLGVLA